MEKKKLTKPAYGIAKAERQYTEREGFLIILLSEVKFEGPKYLKATFIFK